MAYKRKPKFELNSNPLKRHCSDDSQGQFQPTYATGTSLIPHKPDADSDLDIEDSSEALQHLGKVHDQAKNVPWFLGASDALQSDVTQMKGGFREEDNVYTSNGVLFGGAVIGPVLPTARDEYMRTAVVAKLQPDIEESESDDESELVVDIDETQLLDGSEEYLADDGGAWEEGEHEETDATYQHPSDAYHTTLLSRFKQLRAMLQPTASKPGPQKSLKKSSFTYSGIQGGKEERIWRERISNTQPDPADLQTMPESTAINLLRMLPEMLKRNKLLKSIDMALNLSVWVWALLAKVSEYSEIAHGDVSVLRELGKKAQRLARLVQGAQSISTNGGNVQQFESDSSSQGGYSEEENSVAAVVDSVEDDTSDKAPPSRHKRNTSSPLMSPILRAAGLSKPSPVLNEEEEELEKRRTKLLAQIEESSDTDSAVQTAIDADPDIVLAVVLDMILTVVGDTYGQRDLLSSRDALWLTSE